MKIIVSQLQHCSQCDSSSPNRQSIGEILQYFSLELPQSLQAVTIGASEVMKFLYKQGGKRSLFSSSDLNLRECTFYLRIASSRRQNGCIILKQLYDVIFALYVETTICTPMD
jgi:hypothetical protein